MPFAARAQQGFALALDDAYAGRQWVAEDAAQVLEHDVERHALIIVGAARERDIEPDFLTGLEGDCLGADLDFQDVRGVGDGNRLHFDVEAAAAAAGQIDLLVGGCAPYQLLLFAARLANAGRADDLHIAGIARCTGGGREHQ